MLVTSDTFSTLLQALGLTQGLYKPIPLAVINGSGVSVTNSHFTDSEPALLSYNPGSAFADNGLEVRPVSFLSSSAQIMHRADASCDVPSYDTAAPSDVSFPPFDQAAANIYRYRQQQSVNLGSWFVQEQWMVPSLFTCASGGQISELDIASGWNSTTAARAVLERHWDTFINQSDFEYLSSIGINTVRLPIGYWSLGPYYCQNTPYAAVADVYQNSWPRVVRAINMAAAAGIGVLVDLHGAVGSQNGQPHSGISDGMMNLFSDPGNMDKTIDVLTFLIQQLVYVTNVVGIQILNEPQNVPELLDFYSRAITSMRQTSPAADTFPLYLHDGFDMERCSQYIAPRSDFVVQDHHSYFVFTPSDEAEPASQHTGDVESTVADSLATASAQAHRNLVVDEWSCALTPESIASAPNPEQVRKDFCTSQMEVYANTTAGWGFWSYNKENCDNDPGWCFKAAVGRSLPSTFFSYNNTDPALQQSFAAIAADMVLPLTTEILASAQSFLPSPTSGPSLWPTNAVSKRSTSRLEFIHRRRQSRSDIPAVELNKYHERDIASTQQSTTKGYSDGFLTAKTFASYGPGASRLGFTGQFMNDSIAALGSTVIACGTEDTYRQWFMNGLRDGEAIVMSALR